MKELSKGSLPLDGKDALWYLQRYMQLKGLSLSRDGYSRSRALVVMSRDLDDIKAFGSGFEVEGPEEVLHIRERVLESGGFKLDFNSRQLLRPDGETVKLTPLESRLLYLLMSNPGRLVEYQELSRIWGPNIDVKEIIVYGRVYIRYLRKKLGDRLDPYKHKRKYIETIDRQGYMWIAEEVESEEEVAATNPLGEVQTFLR